MQWLEMMLILMVLAGSLWRGRLHQSPLLFLLAASLFVVAMNPWLDPLARHSLWLHSWQSVVVHFWVPLLWLAANYQVRQLDFGAVDDSTPAQPSQFADGWGSLLATGVIALLSVIWMLPDMHGLMMTSPLLYAVGKWMMALSGFWLCWQSAVCRNAVVIKGMTALMVLPLLVCGALMMAGLLDYSAAMQMAMDGVNGDRNRAVNGTGHGTGQIEMVMPAQVMTSYVEAAWFSLPLTVDQWLAGLLLVSGAAVYWLADAIMFPVVSAGSQASKSLAKA
ncbi:hypothetical protein [Oceanobacter mangrovi]|uniref:hypothetical protein n=1 Tax=Oceanobacter mangrovi TaxID=2862510 RepID=UPI001C8E3CD1|nr:hypothetical protein [Oceanobacter mangrovi]